MGLIMKARCGILDRLQHKRLQAEVSRCEHVSGVGLGMSVRGARYSRLEECVGVNEIHLFGDGSLRKTIITRCALIVFSLRVRFSYTVKRHTVRDS